MDQFTPEQEIQQFLKPYYEEVIRLEESDKLKQAQITTLKLAIQGLEKKFHEHLKLQDGKEKKGLFKNSQFKKANEQNQNNLDD